MRNVQHKKEAFWFYRFLSFFYDKYVNPFFWTQRMRDESLAIADLERDHKVVDVGSGTGFTTQGIAATVNSENINCIDQSPHQMQYARRKTDIKNCTFQLGDAEDLPFENDSFDRYVSAGSIEYWPEPQRGMTEAYRVIKKGGKALMIGPLRPKNTIGRWIADTWMLFPEEEEYIKWFIDAGFVDLQKVYVQPHWVLNEKYGIALVGTKPTDGESPLQLPPQKLENVRENMSIGRKVQFFMRLLVGNIAGFLYIPMAILAIVFKPLRMFWNGEVNEAAKGKPDPMTPQQKIGMILIFVAIVYGIYSIF